MEEFSPKEMVDEPSQEDIISLVNSIFKVGDFTKTEFSLEFRIEDLDFKSKFEELARRLENKSFACKLEQMDDSRYIIIQKFTPRKSRMTRLMSSSWTPRISFAVLFGILMIDGHYRTVDLNNIVSIGDPFEMAIIYTISLLGILGVHELGHMVAAKIHRLKTTWPLFMPGLPYISGIGMITLPTFGAVIQSKGLTINRQILFDVAIAGPIAGLVIAIIVSLYGAYTAPILDIEVVEHLYEEGQKFRFGEPLFFKGALALFDKGGFPGNDTILTPVLWASWIGFFLTFLNLMPAWQLDGGHIARTVFGPKWHRYTTYGSIIVLLIIGLEFVAIIFYFLFRRNFSAQPLDDISPLTKNRKLAYIGIIPLAVLCMPIPENLCIPIIRTLCIL